MNKTLFSTLLWLLLPADWAGGHIAAGLCLNMQTVLTSVASCSEEYCHEGVNANEISQNLDKEVLLAKIPKTAHQQRFLPSLNIVFR